MVFGRPFVKRFALRHRTAVCPVCDVGVVAWIKMPLGMEIGRAQPRPTSIPSGILIRATTRPGHIVLDGDPAPLPKKGGAQQPPLFGPCLLWRNGWMDQDATWFGGRPRPRPHCVRWGPSCPERGIAAAHFSAHVYCGQTAGWIKMPFGTQVGLVLGHVVRWGPNCSKEAQQPPPLLIVN